MTDKAGVKQAIDPSHHQATDNTSPEKSEDKLLLLLMVGLAVVLVVALLVWRAVNKEADEELMPTAAQKHAIWFDKDGVVRKTQPTAAPAANDPALVELAKQESSTPNSARQATVSSTVPGAGAAQPIYWIQLASLSSRENAEALRDKVAAGSSAIEIAHNQRNGKSVYAVRVVVQGNRAKADKLAQQIAKKHGLQPLVMTPR